MPPIPVKERVRTAVGSGYVRQALERAGAEFDRDEIDYMIGAIEMRIRKGE